MNLFIFTRTVGLLGLLTQAAYSQVTHAPVAITGLPAPGTSGAMYQSFGDAALNANGQVVFAAALTGSVTPQNDAGLWAGPPSVLALVARDGSRAPGTSSGVLFDSLSNPLSAAPDQVAFSATLMGLGVSAQNDTGIWAGSSAAPRLVAREGGLPPGILNGGVQFDEFRSFEFNSAGDVAFSATMRGLGINLENDKGLWAGPASSPSLVARTGNAAPGVGNASVKFNDFGPVAFNTAGELAFNGMLTGLGVAEQNDTGVWAGPGGALRLVAREGTVPPGVANVGIQFSVFGPPVLSAAHLVAFEAILRGAVDSQNDTGIWAGTASTLRLVAREGSNAPGIASSSVQFAELGSPVLDAAGQIAFGATLRGLGISRENSVGIWAGASTAPSLVARAGDHAPGTPSGANFLSFGAPVFTAAGTVAFYATLTGLGVGFENKAGIWASDAGGQLHLMVREGDFLRTGDVTRQIAPDGLSLIRNQGGDTLSSSGVVQLLFHARFTDSTNGLFVASVGIPAPAITAITRNGSSIQVQFSGISGVVYAVEYSTDATDGTWQMLVNDLIGTGGILTISDSIRTGQPTRLYRVKVLTGR